MENRVIYVHSESKDTGFRAVYMHKSAITPNFGSLSSAVTLTMRSRSKTQIIYLTCLSNMSMKKKMIIIYSLSLIRYMQKGSILLQFDSFSFAVILTNRLRSQKIHERFV